MNSPEAKGDYSLTPDELESLTFEDEAQPVEPEESEAVVEEQQDDEPADDTSTPEPEKDGEQNKQAEASAKRKWSELDWANIDWTDYDKATLEQLPPHLASQRQYLSRLQTDYQKKIKELEAKAAQPGAVAAPEPEAPKGPSEAPPMPSFNDDEATFTRKLEAREAWLKGEAERTAKREAAQALERVQKIEQDIQRQRDEQVNRAVQERLNYIEKCDGWSPEVGEQLDVLLEANPQLIALAVSDDGARQLVRFAKMAVDERNAKVAKATHEASAPERVVRRPAKRSPAKDAADAITGDSPEEWIEALANRDEFAGLFDR